MTAVRRRVLPFMMPRSSAAPGAHCLRRPEAWAPLGSFPLVSEWSVDHQPGRQSWSRVRWSRCWSMNNRVLEEKAMSSDTMTGSGSRPGREAREETRGRLRAETSHERIQMLADPGSFTEFGSKVRHRVTAFGMQARRPEGDGVVTGLGRVSDRTVVLFAQDSAVLGGTLREMHAAKIMRGMGHAGRSRGPRIGLLCSAGARLLEGGPALDGYRA